MKKFMFTMCLLCVSLAMHATQFRYLILQQADGTQLVLPATGVKITSQEGQLIATASGATNTLALSTLEKMYFSNESVTGAQQVKRDVASCVNVVGTCIQVKACEGDNIVITDASGELLLQALVREARVVQCYVAPGKRVYIVNINGQSSKISVR